MARKRKGNPINGILLLDKPTGISSNDAIQKVKRLYQAQKVGHTGALDPLATGMLPICFGEATKFAHYLLETDKRYRVVAQLGIRTDTSDSEGQIIAEKEVQITSAQIEHALNAFRGDILQVPTMFSALKHQGKPLYEYARNGTEIEREARPITIYEATFCHYDEEKAQLELEIHCSKGTYIRTIIDDLGEALQCGAHVIALRRLQVGDYPSEKMITIERLQEKQNHLERLLAHLLPSDSAVLDFQKVDLSDEQAQSILLGRTILLSANAFTQQNDPQLVRLYWQQQFIGIGIQNNDKIQPKRLIATESA